MRTVKVLIPAIVITFQTYLFSEETNFLLYDLRSKTWLQEEGPHCDERISPCSTFKIALSLIGFDSGILIDDSSPEWPWQEDYIKGLSLWNQPHTPKLWMHHSCVWFSQVLTTQLGIQRLQQYLEQFNYGNKDLSGDPGKNNGLTRAWLSSSLKISLREQIFFLEKILQRTLPVSDYSITITKQILFKEEINGWKMYGKTGSGYRVNSDGKNLPDLQSGWFIGWLENEDRVLLFAYNLRDDEKIESFASLRARDKLKQFLKEFTHEGIKLAKED